MRIRIRLTTGIDVLEEWTLGASGTDRDAVYEALFAVADGHVLVAYDVFCGDPHSREFFVQVRENLVMKVRLLDDDTFGIAYVGPLAV